MQLLDEVGPLSYYSLSVCWVIECMYVTVKIAKCLPIIWVVGYMIDIDHKIKKALLLL